MPAPLAQRALSPLPLSEEQYTELRTGIERELRRTVQGLELRMRHQALQLLDGLRRMHAGTYGVCAACRSPIAYERLLAIPETSVCVRCSRSSEWSSS
jgi:RNA polymerase-binding transcription factor DksA